MNNKTKRASKSSQERQYDPADYVNNLPMIKRLIEDHKELKDNFKNLEIKLELKETTLREKEIENEISKLKLKSVDKQILPDFMLNMISTLLFGIGVNIATTLSQFGLIGWVMIFASIVLEIGQLLQRSRRSN